MRTNQSRILDKNNNIIVEGTDLVMNKLWTKTLSEMSPKWYAPVKKPKIVKEPRATEQLFRDFVFETKKRPNRCIDCNVEISFSAKRCRRCSGIARRKKKEKK